MTPSSSVKRLSTVPCTMSVGHVDLRDEIAGTATREPGGVVRVDDPGRDAGLIRVRDVRVDRPPGRRRDEEPDQPFFGVSRLREARVQRVPRDHRRDGVDATVDRGRDELDAAAVRAAGHPDARIARPVELHAGLRRDPVEHPLHVSALEGRAVGLDRSRRLPEAARVPGQDVVAGLLERRRCRAEPNRPIARRVGVAGLPPTRTHEDRRRRLRRGRAAGVRNQCMRILVPSNEVRVQSLATPGTLVATGRTRVRGNARRRRRCGRRRDRRGRGSSGFGRRRRARDDDAGEQPDDQRRADEPNAASQLLSPGGNGDEI